MGRAGSRTGSGVSLLIQFSMSAFAAIVTVSLIIIDELSSAPRLSRVFLIRRKTHLRQILLRTIISAH